MKTIYLKGFIEKGKFGSITIGSTKEEASEVLGENDFEDFGETQMLSLGWYEFFFWTKTGKIFGIQNDHLQADCTNHGEMIDFKNEKLILDKWFLKVGQNITFKEIKEILEQNNIPFIVQPPYDGCDENIIKCLNSNVYFDFCSEFEYVKLDKKGYLIGAENYKKTNQDDFVLNGIGIFEKKMP